MSDDKLMKRPDAAIEASSDGLISIEHALAFGEQVVESGLAPKGVNAAGVVVMLQAGHELGLTKMQSLSGLTCINGRVGVMCATAKAIIRAKGGIVKGTKFNDEIVHGDNEEETYARVWCHRFDEDSPTETRFSVAQAIKAGLWKGKDPWRKFPGRMLLARAWGFHFRDHYSDFLAGLYLSEEIEVIPAAPADGPRPALVAPPSTPDPLMEELTPDFVEPKDLEPLDVKPAPEGGVKDSHPGTDPVPSGTKPVPSAPEVDFRTGEVLDNGESPDVSVDNRPVTTDEDGPVDREPDETPTQRRQREKKESDTKARLERIGKKVEQGTLLND